MLLFFFGPLAKQFALIVPKAAANAWLKKRRQGHIEKKEKQYSKRGIALSFTWWESVALFRCNMDTFQFRFETGPGKHAKENRAKSISAFAAAGARYNLNWVESARGAEDRRANVDYRVKLNLPRAMCIWTFFSYKKA